MLDYLDWRGDLSFEASPLNEVDALIFAWLGYYRFEELGEASFDGLSLRELAGLREQLCGPFPKLNPATSMLPSTSAACLLNCAAQTRRFGETWVSGFRGVTDAERGVQFAAVTFQTDDGLRAISYRGTDDTLAGWKEDCELSFSESVPAQKLAVEYLEAADGRAFVLCGHSKGGNLAMYAALYASEARCAAIRAVYDFDGPGFCFDIRDLDRYACIRERTVKIIPESSIVGMLLDHDDNYQIVKSHMAGILQHDAMYWQVLGAGLVRSEKRSASSIIMDNALREWIDGMSNGERKEFVEALFTVLEGTGAERTNELPERILRGGLKGITGTALRPEQKKMLRRLLLELVRAGNASLYDAVKNLIDDND